MIRELGFNCWEGQVFFFTASRLAVDQTQPSAKLVWHSLSMEESKAWRSPLSCGWCCGWECVELSPHPCMCSRGAWLSTETILLIFYTTDCLRIVPLLDIQTISRLVIVTVLFIGFMSGWPRSVQLIHTLCAMKIKILAMLEDSTFKMMAKDTMERRTTFLTKWLQCQVIFNGSICMVLCHLGYMVPWTYIVSRETPRTSLSKLSTPHNNLWRIHPVAGYIPDDIWRHPCHLQHYPSLHHSAN